MMIRRIFLCVITMCAMSMSVMAVGIPTYDPDVYIEKTTDLFTDIAFTEVTSAVYALPEGYLYTYQVVNKSTDKYTWFSVAMNPGTSIIEKGWELPGIDLSAWEPAMDDEADPTSIQAMQGLFKKGLPTNGSSALMWFTSEFGPGSSLGALGKVGAYAEGFVWAPQVPEPMTVALLGLGWLAVRTFRRKG